MLSKCAQQNSFRNDAIGANAKLESRISPSKRTRAKPRASFLASPSRFDDDEVLRRHNTNRHNTAPKTVRRRRRRRRKGLRAMSTIHDAGPLVSANDALGIWAVVLASAHFGVWAEKKPWGAALGGACLIAALTTLILANLGKETLPF